LLSFLKTFKSKNDVLKAIEKLNLPTKDFLIFDNDPYTFLEELILEKKG